MKKSTFVILLLLSSFLVTSSYSYTILTEPNMTKDFVLSTDYETHSQSITSFGKTSAEDVLLYPDGLLTAEFFATGGDTGFGNTYAVDASYFTVVTDNELEFDDIFEGLGYVAGDGITGYFTYSIYGVIFVGGDHSNVEYSRDGISWSAPFDDIDSTGYHTGTVSIDLQYTETFYLNFESSTQIDYAHIQFFVDPIPSQNMYVETFADISDWTFDSESAGLPSRSFTSDGDVLTFEIGYDDTGNEYAKYDTPVSVSDTDYLEIRFLCSPSSGATLSTALSVYLDGTVFERVFVSDLWTTKKYLLSDYVSGDQSELTFMIDDWGNPHASDTGYVKFEYIRIGHSDEMGWQHDGSTTQGFDERTISVVTDGDTLNISNSGASDYCNLWFDVTSTVATISDLYYPFVEFNISAVKASTNAWLFRIYDSDGTYWTYGYSYATGTFRFNLASVADLDDLKFIRFYCVADQWFTLEKVQLYSIANYTYVAGGGESTNDYSYVEDGKLVIHTDTYTKWNHDQILAVPILSYSSTFWNATIEGDDSGFRFRELLDTNTLWDQGITTGYLVGTTLTDFDLLIYSNCNISAISFLDQLPEWNEIIDDAEFYLLLAIDETSLNMALVFLGLIMIPSSTIYLVVGGRESLSNDKVFFFLISFVIGWALVIGGIM